MKATPRERADRWCRMRDYLWNIAHEPSHRNLLAYSAVEADLAIRDLRRALLEAFTPLLNWLAKRLPA